LERGFDDLGLFSREMTRFVHFVEPSEQVHPANKCEMDCYKMTDQHVYTSKNKQMLQNYEPSLTTKNIRIKPYYKMTTLTKRSSYIKTNFAAKSQGTTP